MGVFFRWHYSQFQSLRRPYFFEPICPFNENHALLNLSQTCEIIFDPDIQKLLGSESVKIQMMNWNFSRKRLRQNKSGTERLLLNSKTFHHPLSKRGFARTQIRNQQNDVSFFKQPSKLRTQLLSLRNRGGNQITRKQRTVLQLKCLKGGGASMPRPFKK